MSRYNYAYHCIDMRAPAAAATKETRWNASCWRTPGGLDTSVAIPWLAETYGAEVIAVTMDLGQGENLEFARDRALATGAVKRARDRRPRGVRARLHPAGAPGRRHLRGPLPAGHGARPAADREEAGRDRPPRAGPGHRPRLHRQGQRPGASRRVGAGPRPDHQGVRAGARLGHDAEPTRSNTPASAASRCRSRRQSPYSTDENLWGRSIECGILEDPWEEPPEDAFALTRSGAGLPGRAGLPRARRSRPACRPR